MRLSSDSIAATVASFETIATAEKLLENAKKYKSYDLSFTRFSWDLYWATSNKVRNDAISKTSGVEVIGGCFVNVTDNNIDTMIRAALKVYTGLTKEIYDAL